MNVYDFDETIYDGDCTRDFVFYCMKNYPIMLFAWPKLVVYAPLFLLKIIKKTVFKEKLYSFLKYIPNSEEVCDTFVSQNIHKIKGWYKEQQREDDLIISASPEFLIKRFCEKAGIKNCMASIVDIHTGKYTGLNCYGEEKVRRFDEHYQRGTIEKFYSDSYSDSPLAAISKEAYIVKDDLIRRW